MLRKRERDHSGGGGGGGGNDDDDDENNLTSCSVSGHGAHQAPCTMGTKSLSQE
jgi:hypothetical protein